jgi:PilZ domain-containing protein
MSADKRQAKRRPVTVNGMLYAPTGKPLGVATVRNISASGAQLELEQEVELPPTFHLSLARRGHVRRSCKKVWQFATVVGVSFFARPREQ